MVLAAVTVEASEGDIEPPVGECDRGALLLGRDEVVARVVAIRRVDVPVPEHLVARQADRHEPVPNPLPALLAGQLGLFGDEDLVGGGVDDGRPGDPERVDVPATYRRSRIDHRLGHRGPDVQVPVHLAGAGCYRIDRVVLGGDIHRCHVNERLPIDTAVEGVIVPGRTTRQVLYRRVDRVVPRARVPIVIGPKVAKCDGSNPVRRSVMGLSPFRQGLAHRPRSTDTGRRCGR